MSRKYVNQNRPRDGKKPEKFPREAAVNVLREFGVEPDILDQYERCGYKRNITPIVCIKTGKRKDMLTFSTRAFDISLISGGEITGRIHSNGGQINEYALVILKLIKDHKGLYAELTPNLTPHLNNLMRAALIYGNCQNSPATATWAIECLKIINQTKKQARLERGSKKRWEPRPTGEPTGELRVDSEGEDEQK